MIFDELMAAMEEGRKVYSVNYVGGKVGASVILAVRDATVHTIVGTIEKELTCKIKAEDRVQPIYIKGAKLFMTPEDARKSWSRSSACSLDPFEVEE